MIVRNKEKTEQLVQELKEKGTQSNFKIIVADFKNSVTDPNLFDRIKSELSDIDIGLLVNNAGVAYVLII